MSLPYGFAESDLRRYEIQNEIFVWRDTVVMKHDDENYQFYRLINQFIYNIHFLWIIRTFDNNLTSKTIQFVLEISNSKITIY